MLGAAIVLVGGLAGVFVHDIYGTGSLSFWLSLAVMALGALAVLARIGAEYSPANR